MLEPKLFKKEETVSINRYNSQLMCSRAIYLPVFGRTVLSCHLANFVFTRTREVDIDTIERLVSFTETHGRADTGEVALRLLLAGHS